MSDTKSYSLQDLMEQDNNRVVSVRLPVLQIGYLTQVRRTFTDIEELGESIRTRGQITKGIVAALSPTQASRYVKEINAIRGSSHTRRDLPVTMIDGKKVYLALVAGERRLRAVKWALENGRRRTRHFDGRYRADLHFGMTVADAISVQFQENRHQQVPAHEEAAAAFDFYRWQKRRNPKLSKARFGRSIGRSDTWVRRAVRFCSLPEALQALAASKKVSVPYGILTETARYANGLKALGRDVDENELIKMATDAVMRKVTVAKFRESISKRLHHLRTGQSSLFKDLPELRKPPRQVVAPEFIKGLWGFLEYMKSVEGLRQHGFFGDESPFDIESDSSVLSQYSPGSPIHLSANLMGQMRDMLPHLEKLAQQEGGKHRPELAEAITTVGRAREVFDRLGEVELTVANSAG